MRAALVIVLVAAWVGVAGAQPGGAVNQLNEAATALRKGEYRKAEALAAPLATTKQSIAKQDRAEAWRIVGLSRYFQKQLKRAETAFVEYLKLAPNAHLEPSLVPPEAIIFFESVRSRHAATLHQYRPKVKVKRRWILNWLPPFGQFQNGHRLKGAIVGTAGVLLLAANVASFFVLRSWCDDTTVVCKNDRGEEIAGRAKTLRLVNLSSAIAFGALYAYAVTDGLIYFRRSRTSKRVSVGIAPSPGGAYISLHARF